MTSINAELYHREHDRKNEEHAAACDYCSQDFDAEICGDYQRVGPAEFVCTRFPGHGGKHVACGGHHEIVSWSSVEEPPNA